MDETPGSSIEDKLFLEHMNTKVALDSDGHWKAPLPFRENRQVLPNNRSQAVKRVEYLDRSLLKDTVKKDQIVEFIHKMIENGHAEIAQPLPTGSER